MYERLSSKFWEFWGEARRGKREGILWLEQPRNQSIFIFNFSRLALCCARLKRRNGIKMSNRFCSLLLLKSHSFGNGARPATDHGAYLVRLPGYHLINYLCRVELVRGCFKVGTARFLAVSLAIECHLLMNRWRWVEDSHGCWRCFMVNGIFGIMSFVMSIFIEHCAHIWVPFLVIRSLIKTFSFQYLFFYKSYPGRR